MQKAGYISRADCDSLKALPLTVRFSRMDHKEGLAPYFREYLRLTLTAKKPDRKRYASWQGQKFSEDSLAWETNLCTVGVIRIRKPMVSSTTFIPTV